MRSSSVFVVMSALGLATALSSLPRRQVASAQPRSTDVALPATGATVSSTQACSTLPPPPPSTGESLWNSTHRGRRQLHAPERRHRQGSSGTTTAISITVSNRAPTMSFVLPPLNGDNVSGTQAVFDAVGPAGVTQVFFAFRAPGYPGAGPPPTNFTFVQLAPSPPFTVGSHRATAPRLKTAPTRYRFIADNAASTTRHYFDRCGQSVLYAVDAEEHGGGFPMVTPLRSTSRLRRRPARDRGSNLERATGLG
jgi:hypothetical protein